MGATSRSGNTSRLTVKILGHEVKAVQGLYREHLRRSALLSFSRERFKRPTCAQAQGGASFFRLHSEVSNQQISNMPHVRPARYDARVVGTRLPYSARVLCSIGGTPSLSPSTNPKCTPSRYGAYGLLPRAAGNRSSRQNASPPRARHRRAIIPWPERRDREDHDVDMQETAGPEHRRDLKNRKASVLDTPQHPSIGILL